ncbi:beta-galactosidase [Cohnella abietis]|uniref:Beta-galactosidase n=1 Tax=Cohnella abietis TaxID=2507935 RepID=A0A3T1CZ79_9BACL|nr:beta-galactosidase [Cohnella abietis]BBI31167.1 beta-galactosidase [Cohnella abietis]
MQQIEFDNQSYLIDGKPIYLISGEFHYFRVPKCDWKHRMELFKAAGGNCLATYIPWLVHETEEGNIVFGGTDEDGTRDLEGFLQAAQECGLYVIARPGPYQYSELKYGGLPSWLCENYPEIGAMKLDGSRINHASVSYLHPLFLEKVVRWFAVVCPILAKFTVTSGGPIAFTQFDNELMGFHLWFYGPDYNPVTMGFGREDGRYPLFLRNRYGSIDHLNEAYGTDFADFASALPTELTDDARPELIRRRKDYFDFYYASVAEFAVLLCREMRAHGIDTPFVHNSANPNMNAFFKEMAEELGGDFLLGSDHYYNLGQHWDQNNPTPQYAIKVFYSNEMLRLMGYPPSIFELPSGSCSDWPPILPEDSLACYMTNLALGMKGHNYYIFTGGPNPPGAGLTTDLYDFGAPIGTNNEIRPLYYVQKEYNDFVLHNEWLVRAERAGDFRIAIDFEHARSDKYWKAAGDFSYTNDQAWEFTLKGVMTTAFCASLSPVMIDLDLEDWVADITTPLFVAASLSMGADNQRRLVDFVKSGGKLIIAPVLPEYDEALRPCRILADFLGAKPAIRHQLPVTRATVCGVVNVSKERIFHQDVPHGAEQLGVEEFTGLPLSWSKRFGEGEAIWLGMEWWHSMREQELLLEALLQRLGLRRLVQSSTPQVWTSLRTDGARSMLFLMNLHSSPVTVESKVSKADGSWLSLGERTLAAMKVETIELAHDVVFGTGM